MATAQVKIFISDSVDPYFNLAAEDSLYKSMDSSEQILFLWRNEPTVVIGRFQNPWLECDVEAMEEGGIHLARRQSGGGTVFHDLGNTNFTFLSGAGDFDKRRNLEIVVNALGRLGINTEISPRNDILVDGYKISGSAFKQKRDRCFHHGTLLIDADLKGLSRYLHAPERNVTAKGVASVRSPVINLAEIQPALNHNQVCLALTDEFNRQWGSTITPQSLDSATLADDPELNAYYAELKSWDWRFGKTPGFVQNYSIPDYLMVPGGRFEINVKNGVIEAYDVEMTREGSPDSTDKSDISQGLEILKLLGNALIGCRYEANEVRKNCSRVGSQCPPVIPLLKIILNQM